MLLSLSFFFIHFGDQTAHQVLKRCVPAQQMADFEVELSVRRLRDSI